MATNDFNLLDMPIEMLQHISRFVTAESILMLRLTCKTLAAAAFDAVAEEYVRVLKVFILSPARLEKLAAIISCPHLAYKVDCLILTTDPFEEAAIGSVSTVAGTDASLLSEQHEIYLNHRDDQLRLHGDDDLATSKLLAILEELKKHQQLKTRQCTLGVDLDRIVLDGETPCPPNLLHDIMCTVSRTGHRILSIRTSDMSVSRLDDLMRHPSVVPELMKAVTGFVFYLIQDGELPAEWLPDLAALPRMLALTPLLHSLNLEFDSNYENDRDKDFMLNLSNDLILANSLAHLEWLELTSLRVKSFDILFEALGRCRGTLGGICLRDVTILSPRNRWSEVLEYLRTFPNLSHLELVELFLFDAWQNWAIHVRHPTEVDQSLTLKLDMDCQREEAIDAALANVLERGIVAAIKALRYVNWPWAVNIILLRVDGGRHDEQQDFRQRTLTAV
ncbi:hypothetical protein LTR37_012038 [Vermiconidia calcicola]|uniref:Uncharacterized protein n=1 Tax=Vermiconidia calcicola TaxID=1690605 RepID=A0ACC3N099_9PEZI|nr:hypothetical protein LTR37_012038 [Vermiconidia calcicola]